MKQSKVEFKSETIDGLDIFYREVGPKHAPTILLLHGFPSSSHMFRDLLLDLRDDYHLIAPDYPGFGYSSMPSLNDFSYTFDHLAEIIERFIVKKDLNRFYLYLQDYGGPIGMRIASRSPEKIAGLIIQNANAYLEGVGEALAKPVMPFWETRNAETEAPLRGLLTIEGTKLQYQAGTTRPELLSPDAWNHDQQQLDRPGNKEIQLQLLFDYRSNVAKYEQWQKYLNDSRPATLITWGIGDPFFTEKGARAYLRDVPDAELHLLETGHFALEDHHEEIASLMKNFIAKQTK